jgi:hypothetical protein
MVISATRSTVLAIPRLLLPVLARAAMLPDRRRGRNGLTWINARPLARG